jgi:hypothetical protein
MPGFLGFFFFFCFLVFGFWFFLDNIASILATGYSSYFKPNHGKYSYLSESDLLELLRALLRIGGRRFLYVGH